jgi:hypothetical protein
LGEGLRSLVCFLLPLAQNWERSHCVAGVSPVEASGMGLGGEGKNPLDSIIKLRPLQSALAPSVSKANYEDSDKN